MKAHYLSLPSWGDDISSVTEFNKLPITAQSYITYLEKNLHIPITRIGVGPGRQQVIKR